MIVELIIFTMPEPFTAKPPATEDCRSVLSDINTFINVRIVLINNHYSKHGPGYGGLNDLNENQKDQYSVDFINIL